MASYTYGSLTIPVTADTKTLRGDITGAATAAGHEAAGSINTSMTNGLKAAGGLAASVGKSVATGLATATVAATGFGVEAFKTAARVGEMDASLKALATANNLSYDTMQKSVKEIRGYGIEAGVAQNLVAQFARNQLDLGKSTDLARVAQDAAVISGKNSSETLDALIHGITTQNTQVLRNAGITVNASKAQEDFAKAHGKTVKELTEAEKSQALLNAVLREGSSVAGAYEAAMREPGKVLRSFPRLVDDIKLSVGQGLVQAMGPAILQMYDLGKALSTAIAPGGALSPIFDAIGVAVGKLIAPLTRIIEHWTKWIENLRPEQVQKIVSLIERFGPVALAAAAGLTAMVAPGILGQIPVLGGLISNLTGPLSMVTSGVGKMAGSMVSAIPGIGGMGSAAGLLPAAMNPVGLAIAAVVAALAGLMIASKDFREAVFGMAKDLWEGLKPALSSVWEMIKVFGKAIWDIVKAIGDALAPAMRNLSPLVKTLGELFGANLAGGADGAGGAMSAIVPVITGVIKVIGFLLDITTKVLVPLIEIPLKLAVMAQQAANVVNPLKLLGQAIEWLTETAKKLWHWITGNSPGLIPAFGALGSAASGIANLLGGPISAAFSGLVSVVQSSTSAISGAVSGAWSAMPGIISGAMGTMQSAVSSGFSSMVSTAKSAGTSMIDGLKSGLEGAKSLGGWIGSNVTGPVTGFIKSGLGIGSPSYITIEFGEGMIAGLQRGMQSAEKLGGWIDSHVTGPLVGWIKSGLGIGSPSSITITFGADVIEGLKLGMEKARDLGGWVKENVCGPLLGAIQGFFGIGSPSTVMMSVGEDMVAGLEQGLEGVQEIDLGHGPSISSPLGGGGGSLAGAAGMSGGSGATVNVYPRAGQDEREIAAMVSRELAWSVAGGVS